MTYEFDDVAGPSSSSSGFGSLLASHKRALDSAQSAPADLLAHPLLSSRDPLSAANIATLLADTEASRADAKQVFEEQRTAAVASIHDLIAAVGAHDEQLANLPDQIGSVEDALGELCVRLRADEPDEKTDVHAPAAAPSGQVDSSQSLLQTLSQQHTLLADLENVRDYLGVLAHAEELSRKAVEAEGQGRINDAIAFLAQLTEHSRFVAKTTKTSVKAIAFVNAQKTKTFTQLAKALEAKLASALSEAGWPPPPAELQHIDQGRSGNGEANARKAQSPDAMLATSPGVRTAWRDLMLLQKKSEKMGIVRRASARIVPDYEDEADQPTTSSVSPGSNEYQPLLAVQCLLHPLLLRFYYHFDSERSTNRLDKPEWYFAHMLSVLRANASLFDPVRGAVAKLCNNASPTHDRIRYDLSAELLHGILRPLIVKLTSSVPLLLQNAQLLSHTIMQTVQFDQDIRSILQPVLPTMSPVHLADTLLSNEAVFEAWVQSERTFALTRLNEELEGAGAWLVGDENGVEDDESAAGSWAAMAQDVVSSGDDVTGARQHHDGAAGNGVVKTTRSARAVVSLVDGLTARYKALSLVNNQLPFLLIQLSVLQGYAHRLERSLDAFESLSSAFSRAIPGAVGGGSGDGGDAQGANDGEADMVRGLRGLGRLLKACLSAMYLSQHLSALSTQSFFLLMGMSLASSSEGKKLLLDFRKWEGEEEEKELDQTSLGELVRRGWRSGGRLASGIRPLTSASPTQMDVATFRTSGAAASDKDAPIDVWEKCRDRFGQIASRTQRAIEKMVVNEVQESLRTYAQRDWDEESDDEDEDLAERADESDNAPTPTLLPSLSTLSTFLTHLLPSLPRVQSNRVYRSIAEALSTTVVEKAVFSGGAHRFSLKGAQTFAQDVQHGWMGVVMDVEARLASTSASKTSAMGARPHAPWRYLIDAAALLALKDDDDEYQEPAGESPERPTLQQACRAAFEPTMAGPSWEQVVEMLQLDDRLSLHLAREILRRRKECPW